MIVLRPQDNVSPLILIFVVVSVIGVFPRRTHHKGYLNRSNGIHAGCDVSISVIVQTVSALVQINKIEGIHIFSHWLVRSGGRTLYAQFLNAVGGVKGIGNVFI